jgi:methyl-accepting chemotaxis protein
MKFGRGFKNMAGFTMNRRVFSNMRIFPRLLVLFVVLVIISSTAIAFLDYFFLQASNTHAQAVKTSFNAQQTATEQQINLERMNALLQARFAQIFASDSPDLGGDPSLAASGGLIDIDITTSEINFDQALTTYMGSYDITNSAAMSTIRTILENNSSNMYLINDQQVALNAVKANQWNDYKNLQDQVLSALNQPQPNYETGYAILYKADTVFQNLQKNWNTVVNTSTLVGQAVTSLSSSEIIPLQIATIGAIALTILIIVATAFIVNISISRPLTQLAALTGRISQGDTNARAHVEGRDEIYTVAISMNTMLDNIVQLMKDAQLRHVSLQAQIEKLVTEIQGIGEGDLRVHAEMSSGSLEVLAKSFNYVVAELGGIVIKFKTLANEVERSTIQAYDDMLQVVEGTDQQIQHITSATAQVLEMAHASRQVVERAQSLSIVGDEAYSTTQDGRRFVVKATDGIKHISLHIDATVERVKKLEERSQEIDTIVKVIAGVAYQTNRLALDAAIQAAMAGENGKGFRAVAEDIRRSAEVAKTQAIMVERVVKQVIEDIKAVAISMYDTEQETISGIQFSREAGTAFDAIYTAIEQQSREIDSINRVAKQQLEISNSVLQTMQNVSALTHQSSRDIHDEAQRMEGVAQLAERLLSSAEVFKLPENQDIFSQAKAHNRLKAPNTSYPLQY